MVEYFQGILILTTNRISCFDMAFKSRIHVTLHYPKLDGKARENIWRNFRDHSRYPSSLEDPQLAELSQEEMNGREIKNAMKAAQLLATSRREPIGIIHIRAVLQATMGLPLDGSFVSRNAAD